MELYFLLWYAIMPGQRYAPNGREKVDIKSRNLEVRPQVKYSGTLGHCHTGANAEYERERWKAVNRKNMCSQIDELSK